MEGKKYLPQYKRQQICRHKHLSGKLYFKKQDDVPVSKPCRHPYAMVTGLFIFFPCLSNTINVHVYSNHGIYELQPWSMVFVKKNAS